MKATIRSHAEPAVIAVRTLAGLLAAVVTGLTVFAQNADPDSIVPLVYPLFPGLIAGLMITGGHGGTHNEEIAARIVAPIVNAIFYAGLILIAHKVWRALLSKPTAYRQF